MITSMPDGVELAFKTSRVIYGRSEIGPKTTGFMKPAMRYYSIANGFYCGPAKVRCALIFTTFFPFSCGSQGRVGFEL